MNLKYHPPVLVKYNKLGNAEHFVVSIITTGGPKECVHNYKWISSKLYKEDQKFSSFEEFIFSGYRPCSKSELDEYNVFQAQVSKIQENEKQIELDKVQVAKDQYERQLTRYEMKYGKKT